MAVAATVFAVIFEAGYLATSAAPYDGLGYLIGRDFVDDLDGRAQRARRWIRSPWFDFSTPSTPGWRRMFYPGFPAPHTGRIRGTFLLLTWPLGPSRPICPGYLVWCAGGHGGLSLGRERTAGAGARSGCTMLAVAPAVADERLHRPDRLPDLGDC